MALSALIFSIGFSIWALKSNPAKAGEPTIDLKRDFQDKQFFESKGALYQVQYNSFDGWKASKILTFVE